MESPNNIDGREKAATRRLTYGGDKKYEGTFHRRGDPFSCLGKIPEKGFVIGESLSIMRLSLRG